MGLLHDGQWEPDATREQCDHDTFDARIGPDLDWTAPHDRAALADPLCAGTGVGACRR